MILTKDSGGAHTVAKLDAAGDLGIPVVIIARPERPPVRSSETVAGGRAPGVAPGRGFAIRGTIDHMRWILRLLANAAALAIATWILSGITLTGSSTPARS